MEEPLTKELLIEIKAQLTTLNVKIDERKELYLTKFAAHEESIKTNKVDIDNAFIKLHAMENDLTKNNENTASLAERVEKLEIAVVSMKETLIKVSVISTFMTAAITAAVIEFFGR